MPTGVSLHIGLNQVDPAHYAGWSGPLQACEADANDMKAIADARGFTSQTLLTKRGTRDAVLDGIKSAAKQLKTGDIFFLTYSGHGGQLPDMNDEEPDATDETWCLFDGELVDDELYAALGGFAQGVRILVFSDSCHSGSVTKMAYYRGKGEQRTVGGATDEKVYRFMPDEIALKTYQQNRAKYDPILSNAALKAAQKNVAATALLISGCQDNQLSADGPFNGLFTAMLLRVWKAGAFKQSYVDFHTEIVKRMPPDQTPNYFLVGAANAAFEAQTPFTV